MTGKGKVSLKGRIFGGLSLFVLVFLAILWLLQTVYLDRIYCRLKILRAQEVTAGAAALCTNLADNTEKFGSEAEEHELRLIIANRDGRILYNSSDNNRMNWIERSLPGYYEKAEENGGEIMVFTDGDAREKKIPAFDEARTVSQEKNFFDAADNGGHQQESLIYARIERGSGRNNIVVATLLITPLDSTVETIRIILITVSCCMLLFGFLLATYFSNAVGKPIKTISDDAGRLAKGDYSVHFTDSRTEEIAALSGRLNIAVQELSKTSKLQRELVANVSHDLRTPLTMIKGYAEVMRDIPGENTADNLQIVIDETERLGSLVSDLLDVSRIEADVVKLNPETYSLTDSIEKVLLRYAGLIRNEGFTIDFEADENIFVTADEEKIYQVLYNLINNAVNYAGEDRRVLVTQKRVNGKVRISVADNGTGIAEEDLPYVWERYYRSNSPHRTERIGTGLGLSIVKHVLNLHGASYGVESVLGKGSTFWFELSCAGVTDRNDADIR